MKSSTLIAKLHALPPDSDLTEIDVLRLFDGGTQSAQARADQIRAFLAAGDLAGLRKFLVTMHNNDASGYPIARRC